MLLLVKPAPMTGIAGLCVLVALCASCASPPHAPEPTSSPAEPGSAATQPARPAVIASPGAKALSLKQANEARDLLQDGQEARAKELLQQALQNDASNETARKLLEQIGADAQQELGHTSFSYTVQSGDTLARLAERHLGDRLRFYILAKYNGISNPNRLAVGQTIRIPGQAPKVQLQVPATPKAAPKAAETVKPARQAEPEKIEEAVKPAEVAPVEVKPKPAPAVDLRHKNDKNAAIERFNKDALAAYHRQDLDAAIWNWNQILQLDPDNESAKYNRAKAIDLKERISKFPKK